MPQTITNISLEDLIEIPSQRSFTDAGQMIVPAAFARTGSMKYLATTLKIKDAVAGEFVDVFRDEDEVFADSSMESFRSAPVTLGHPKNSDGTPTNLTSENAKELQVGVLEGMPTRDEDTLGGTLIIARQDAIDAIEEGAVELSAGYTCDLTIDEDGKYWQKNIKANHIAIVAKGRAGNAMRMADEADGMEASDAINKDDEKDRKVSDKAKDKKKVTDKSEKKVTENEKSSGDNKPKNNDGGKIKEANRVTGQINIDEDDLGNNADRAAIEADILARQKASGLAPAKETVQVQDSTAAVEEETIEQSENYTVYLKAEATAKCAWNTYMASSERLAEHARAAGMYDEAEEMPVFAKAENYDALSAKLDVAEETVTKLNDELEASVEARVAVITIAKDLTALDDFTGKSVDDIRALVVADQLPNLDLKGKSEAYINARFDILTEDSDSGNSQMSQILAHDATQETVKAYVNPVTVARQNMIDRTSKQSQT